MKLIIVGSRDFNDYNFVKEVILDYIKHDFSEIDEVVSGGARGADTLAVQFAKEFGIKMKEFTADWARYGKLAGGIRNQVMVDYCMGGALCFAFPSRESRGTYDMIRRVSLCNKLYKDSIILRVVGVEI